ncbi:hypothetical protein D3C74_201570 [compost metagenome]
MNIYLRNIDPNDYVWIWECRNDEHTRMNSIHTDSISLEDHMSWMKSSSKNPNRKIMIGCYLEDNVGVIRFDIINEDTALISINLSPGHRGKGYSVPILKSLEDIIKQEYRKVKILQAVVKQGNIASIKAFIRANYVKVKEDATIITLEKYI